MRRRIFYGVAAVAVAVFVSFHPLLTREDLSTELESAHRTLLKYRAAVRALEQDLGGPGAAQGELEAMERGLLPGGTTAAAVARLQTEITDLADRAALSITSIRPMVPADLSPYRRIGVQINLTGTTVQLRDFLKAVEESSLLLGIDALAVRVTNVRKPDTIRIKVAVSGLMKV